MQPRRWAGIYRLMALWVLPIFFSALSGLSLAQEISDCMDCHRDPNKVGKVARIDRQTGDIKVVSMLVDEKAFMDSAHGRSKEKFTCIDCHQDLNGVYGEHDPLLKPVDCVTFCHDDPAAAYQEGSHVAHMKEKEKTPPGCKECHMGKNSMRDTPVKDDPFHRAYTNKMCGTCHEEYVYTYCSNLHGQLTSLGYCSKDVANCSDCHGGHEILKASEPDSMIGENKIVETCTQCHKGAGKKFVRHIAHPRFKRPDLYKGILKALKDRDMGAIKKAALDPQSYLVIVFIAYMGIITFTFSSFGLHSLLMWFRVFQEERKAGEGHGH